MKTNFLALNRLLLVLPMLSLLISPGKPVNADTVRGDGTDGQNGGYFTSPDVVGVYGYSGHDAGVYGVSASYGGLGKGYGVYGDSPNGYGVYGRSDSYIGVYGYSRSSYGVYGYSPTGYGVYGYSPTGYSAYFTGGYLGNGSCYYAGGAGFSCTSDRNLKENFTAVNVKEILQRVSHLPITRWNMKGGKTNDQHIGPMAQDFHTAFAIGEDDKHINTADIQGIALAAIKGLYQVVQEKDIKLQKQEAESQKQETKIQNQEAEIAQLHKQIYAMNAQLTARLASLEQSSQASNSQHRVVVAQSKLGSER